MQSSKRQKIQKSSIQSLNHDISNYVGSFLCYVDQMAFYSCHRQFNTKFDIKKLICDNLELIGIDSIWLCNLLKKYSAIIYGSFLFDCIFNTSFNPRDIELISNENAELKKELTSHFRTSFPPPNDEIKFGQIQYSHMNCSELFYTNVNCTPMKFISTIVCWDFCKMTFDGEKLYIYDWNTNWNRSCIWDAEKYLDHHPIEIQKLNFNYLKPQIKPYEDEGFQIQVINSKKFE